LTTLKKFLAHDGTPFSISHRIYQQHGSPGTAHTASNCAGPQCTGRHPFLNSASTGKPLTAEAFIWQIQLRLGLTFVSRVDRPLRVPPRDSCGTPCTQAQEFSASAPLPRSFLRRALPQRPKAQTTGAAVPLLALLLERPVKLSPARKSAKKLWPADTFVISTTAWHAIISFALYWMTQPTSRASWKLSPPWLSFHRQISENEVGPTVIASDPTSEVKTPDSFDLKHHHRRASQWPRWASVFDVGSRRLPHGLRLPLSANLGWRRTRAVRPSISSHVMLACFPFRKI